ncbi:Zinc finger SWIM domain-containing protein 8 [Hypsibius exemplaris]|uniref:Zinc finger SWIM domain-containing protein 8 n=1 Tax=Hypsibius exemplaris TaxID=2072580 RepID=A0A1W0X2H0_HYPEX|nr:Zinc finger SWIM domain-containing protein 8 [Hypsibius exemplaris]
MLKPEKIGLHTRFLGRAGMFEAWDEGAPEQEADQQDRASFDDSDRFDGDSICSYLSEAESACNNWQGWKKSTSASGGVTASPLPQRIPPLLLGDEGCVPSLVELSARQVAIYCPFELVDHHRPPVPEQLQKRIAFWSFPESEEDIRMYSCLASGNAEEFQKGEHLYRAKLVKNLLQIGLHLNASVIPPQANTLSGTASIFNVAITFDRHRITSCSCTCRQSVTSTSWCAHVVAVCLQRIHQPQSATLRAPLSESLSRLDRNQLWKFAQYFIQELPRQALPTAQRLLDELLNVSAGINATHGAPDPTAESSASEMSSWCLDENVLHENIRNLLVKFCIPAPTVCSDVNYLSSSAPPAASEWSNLLRPLRGREPEGMWNLLSIVREMFRKGDNNASSLLTIVTDECLACEQIVVWWYSTKVSHGQNTGNAMGRMVNGISTTAPQHASASLMDETATLWKLAVLNPANTDQDRAVLKAQLTSYHLKCIEKVRKSKSQNPNGQNVPGLGTALRQADIDLFPGFKPAIEVCSLDWKDYPVELAAAFSRSSLISGLKHIGGAEKGVADAISNRGDRCPQIQGTHFVCLNEMVTSSADKDRVSSDTPLSEINSENDEALQSMPTLKNEPPESERLEMLYLRAEALMAHGYACDVRKHSVMLAEELLANPPDFVALEDRLLREAANNSQLLRQVPHRVTHMACSTNVKLIFLVNVFSDSPEYRHMAFRIGLLGLELPRPPAISKALEVKMFHQELELMNLLKKMPVGSEELSVLRQRAKALRDGQMRPRGDALLPLNLATYIFSVFCTDNKEHVQPNSKKVTRDEELGFEAAVAALGMKSNVSEADHPLVCEGTRRQRGDLALLLLVGYKDDPHKLGRVMDRLLDKEIHSLHRKSSSDSLVPHVPSAAPKQIVPVPVNLDNSFGWQEGPSSSGVSSQLGADLETDPRTATSSRIPASLQARAPDNSEDSCALEEDNKAWESKLRCTVFKPRRSRHVESLCGGIDSSAPETTSSDNSPTMVRRHQRIKNLRESDSGSGGDSSSDSRESFKREDEGLFPNNATPKADVFPLEAPSGVIASSPKGPKPRSRKSGPTEPNQPSEAVAHWTFELAKTVLVRAGGNLSTAHYLPSWGQNSPGTHRSLHMCAFQIGLYALGIQNCVCQTWQSRTYSSHVSWISAQATEIGVDAIRFLIDTWEGHLTPPEIAKLADMASRSSDLSMVRAASELALSVLPHAHALILHAIQRALVQCKEQGFGMLELALVTVEAAAKSGGVPPEALFDVSRKWYEMYAETMGEPLANHDPPEVIFSNNQPDPGRNSILGSALAAIMQAPQYAYQQHRHPPPHPVYLAQDGRWHSMTVHAPAFVHPHNFLNQQQQQQQQQFQLPGALPYMVGMIRPSHHHPQQQQQQQLPRPMLHIPQHQQLPQYAAGHRPFSQSVSPFLIQCIMSAYRVGILAMETLARRFQDDRQAQASRTAGQRYSRNPPYGEFVKWLMGVAKKLNIYSVQQLCLVAANAVDSPFVLWEIANDAAEYLLSTKNNEAIYSGYTFLHPMLQKSQQAFIFCIHQKIYHISPPEYEDFVSTVVAMQAVSNLVHNGQASFATTLNEIKRSTSCKKELLDRVMAAISHPH